MAFIEKIKLQNFKSHTLFQKNISSNNIVIHGNNGIGKTNLLESLSFFSNSKGMRANKLENFLQKNNITESKFAQVECQLKQKNYSTNISYKIYKQSGQIYKNFFIDNKTQFINGIQLSINHIKSKREGMVFATARNIHKGKTTHLWEVRIVDEDDHLISIAKMTNIVLNSTKK